MSPDAARCVALLRAARATVATSESLTGGLVAAWLTAVPGASEVVRGGLVVYATDTKAAPGGVPAAVLGSAGPVSEPTALALARGAAVVFGATYGVATTGVAGPDPQPGQEEVPVGTVVVAVVGNPAGPAAGVAHSRVAVVDGTRDQVRKAAVGLVLTELSAVVGTGGPGIPR